MLSEQTTLPNPDLIEKDLAYMTRRWSELGQDVWLELRAFRDGDIKTGKFRHLALYEAVDWAEDFNARGYSLYAVRNPIRNEVSGSASDTDIVAAFYLWADCDDSAAAGNVLRFDGPKWSASVTTGTIPETRAHTYWELDMPCTNMDEWRSMQETIAAHFGSDSTVVNPSRIMRVGGTVTYPAEHKVKRGYIKEVTTIRTEYDEARPPVTITQMTRVFGERAPAVVGKSAAGLQIDTGLQESMDRERAKIKALSGQEWNAEVLRLVGSYVRKGLSDSEIHALTDPLTLDGYTTADTCAEVQGIIDRTRSNPKFEMAEKPTPNFDHAPATFNIATDAPAATTDTPAPKWSLQSAKDFTADFVAPEYLIDGVVQRGRLYTLTAPTGSGKTAVMLYAGTAMSRGEKVCDRDTEAGDVIYMAGENPDDVRGRVIATMDAQKISPDECRLHFIPGTFNIRQDTQLILDAIEALPNVTLVIVDTLAAYFDGDDSNSNAQMLDFARVLRRLTTAKSKPAVIVPAHPVKNAVKNNLTPMGGSSLLNEVDGNLCLWKRDAAVELHWQGKHRGADFDPLMFEIKGVESDLVRDSKGRIMPTVMAIPLLETRALEIATKAHTVKERLLLSIDNSDCLSITQRCVDVGLVNDAGNAKKSSMANLLGEVVEEKLVKRILNNWFLTDKGKQAVHIINGISAPVDLDMGQ